MSNDEPIVRPNLMHLDKAGAGQGRGGGGGCGCGGQGHGGHGAGKGEGGCGCGGHGHASRDFVTIEPVAKADDAPLPKGVV